MIADRDSHLALAEIYMPKELITFLGQLTYVLRKCSKA